MQKSVGNKKIEKLIATYILGCLSKEEEQQLNIWLDTDAHNRELFKKLVEASRVKSGINQYDTIDTNEELKLFNRKVNRKVNRSSNDLSTHKPLGKVLRLSQIRYKWAFVASILLLIGLGYTLVREIQSVRDANEAIQVAVGTNKATLLTDKGNSYLLEGDSIIDIEFEGVEVNHSKNGLIYSGQKDNGEAIVEEHTLIVPRGGTYELKLADGTSVWLNAESRIKYPSLFNEKDRTITLVYGEIYLDVKHDEQHPFKVVTDYGVVKVLGTSFNVRDYPEEDMIRTTLVQGKVAWNQPGSPDENIVIKPNQQVEVNKDNLQSNVITVDAKDFIGWKNNLFEFHEKSLEYIMNEVCRWYDCQVEYDQDVLKDYRFTLRLNKYSQLDDLLNTIQLTNKIKIDFKGDKILIRK